MPEPRRQRYHRTHDRPREALRPPPVPVAAGRRRDPGRLSQERDAARGRHAGGVSGRVHIGDIAGRRAGSAHGAAQGRRPHLRQERRRRSEGHRRGRHLRPERHHLRRVGTTGGSPAARLTARWSWVSRSGAEKPVGNETKTISPTTDASTEFHLTKIDGLAIGDYKLEILLDGTSVATKAIRVAR
jgi:hypothetical protein